MILLLLACNDRVAGDLRVTEVHPLPLDTPGQWFEVSHLHRSEGTDLGPIELTVSGNPIELPDVELGPGERLLIGTAEVDTDVIALDLVADFALDDTTTLDLSRSGEPIFSLDLDGLDYGLGSSAARYAERGDESYNWCMSWESSDGDFATPGEHAGSCSCRMEFTYRFRHVTDPALDLEGSEAVVFDGDGTFQVPGESSPYERTSDAAGQHLTWAFEATGIRYRGTRPYGTDGFVDQPIEIPESVEDYSSGTWSSTGLCVELTL